MKNTPFSATAHSHEVRSSYFNDVFEEHVRVARATQETLQDPFWTLVDCCLKAICTGRKILFFGNGGSAADAQHLATELTVRFVNNRRAIPALSLVTDTSALTAIGNDLGFEYLFSRQIEALGREGDVAIGISTSGKSPNVIKGFEKAKEIGLVSVAFTGRDGGDLGAVCDLMLIVPSDITSHIQEMHITLGQMLCGALERELGLL